MNTASTPYRLDQLPVEHIVLPPSTSMADDVQVIEHDIEEITLPVPDWDADVIPIIH